MKAEIALLKRVQVNHFSDGRKGVSIQMKMKADGLYHIETRLMYKDDEELFKSPIVLPS